LNKISVISAFVMGSAFGVTLIGFAGCNKGESSGGVAAVVNGTPISEKEFLRYMMLKPSVQVQSNRGPVDARVAQPIGFQALNDLVKQKLVVQMAKKEGVYPTEAEITQEIQFRMDGDPNFVKNLNNQGLDTEMIKEALAVELCQDKLVGKGITVSDADIAQYQAQHKEQFMEPATTDLQWIWVKSAAAKKQVDEQLKRGQPFNVVAAQFSEAPGAKEKQGAFPQRIDKQIPPDILKEVKDIQPMRSTEWIDGKGDSGSAKFYVVKRSPSKPVEMTPHIKELVRRRVREIRGSNAREIGKQILAEQRQGTVEIKIPGLQPTWDAYVKQLTAATAPPSLTKPDAGTTTAGAATTTAGTTPAATTGK
jgi:hypothetical protein